ncbi:NUDIX domain-containing protein [Aliiglaciecola sp. SL4]|uniref:NUDIX domain-containing protein n=1 Tax=Aliiglaciecola sp. SL4 TaxID=3239806 RepID=UPI00355C526A
MGFKRIKNTAIENCLESLDRQYLLGRLGRPQELEHIDDEDLEIGISDYKNARYEDAHSHVKAKEYQYILKGMTEYKDIDSGEVHRFVAGDFYVIYPETKYLQKVKQETRILFVKYPAGNDKVNETASQSDLEWATNPLRVNRIDSKGENFVANSLVPATAAAILDDRSRLLLVQRRDSGNWAMPGGTMEMDESLEGCIVREVKEETGLNIKLEAIIGTYTDPNTKIAYSDGEVRREFSVLFYARSNASKIVIDEESTNWKWVEMEQLDSYPMAPSQKKRVNDVISFLKTKTIKIR